MYRLKIFRLCLPLVSLLDLAAVPCLAQTAKITSVKVAGARKYSQEAIVAASGLHVGDTVTRDDLQAAANRLAQLGPFTAAQYRFTSSGENLSVEFQVEEAPGLAVSFDNFPWFTDEELAAALKQSSPLFDGTLPEQGTILDGLSNVLQKLLATRGVSATVERTLVRQPNGEAGVGQEMMHQFKVLGPSLAIEAVRFEDPIAMESQRVQDRLSDLVGKPYSQYAVELFAYEQVRPLYLERGHLRVKFGKPAPRFTAEPKRGAPTTVLVSVSITPGPVYHWAGVEWHGNSAVDPATLNQALAFAPDQVADGMKIMAAWGRIRDEYGRRGYLEAKVEAEPRFNDPAKRVSYRVNVTEGPQYKMGDLVITGLSLASERRLKEAWTLPRGQTFDRVYFDEFLATGIKKALADVPVHYDEVGHWLRTNPAGHMVDVLLDFK